MKSRKKSEEVKPSALACEGQRRREVALEIGLDGPNGPPELHASVPISRSSST